MHRHTTNSISTASAVFWALKKLISREEKAGAQNEASNINYHWWERGEKSWRMLHFLKSFAFFFISVQYGFYYRAITAYDEEKLILIGLIWDVGVAKMRSLKCVECECVCTHNVYEQEQTVGLYLHAGRIQGQFFYHCGFAVFVNSITKNDKITHIKPGWNDAFLHDAKEQHGDNCSY